MSPEMYSIIGVGLALAGLIMPRLSKIDSHIAELRERMAHLEGLLEGLREAINHSRASLNLLSKPRHTLKFVIEDTMLYTGRI